MIVKINATLFYLNLKLKYISANTIFCSNKKNYPNNYYIVKQLKFKIFL